MTDLTVSADNPRNSEGSFLFRKDGTLLFVYTRYRGASGSDDACADLAVVESADGGRTWSDPRICLEKDPSAANYMSVSLLRLPDGRVALMYLRKALLENRMCCMPQIRFSSDETRTWTPAVSISSEAGYFVVNNDRFVLLKSGRLLVPAATGSHTGVFFLSDDGGTVWHRTGGELKLDFPLQEPLLLEHCDGRLHAWYRTAQGCHYRTESRDQGLTWSVPAPDPMFPTPRGYYTPMSIRRNPFDGSLVAVWNDRSGGESRALPAVPEGYQPRTPLILAISRDDGASWGERRMVEDDPRHAYCYTAMAFPEKDTVVLAYCCGAGNRWGLTDLRLRRVSL